ncbi:MAG: hypothetical protein H9534_13445 [Dolichospermum circinale Clear-D4]|nr:hypothetical protein [Dolichospermum circinale Clear-D4]
MFEPILNQCQMVQTKLEDLLQKTVTLSSQVYKIGFFDFNAFNLESKIRDIESQVKALVQEAESATKSVDLVQNSLQTIKVTPKVLEEVKSINKICEQINTMPTMIGSYLEDMLTFLASNNLFGAFMNLIRAVQYALQQITISTLVVIPALPGISSFFSRLLSASQKLLRGR